MCLIASVTLTNKNNQAACMTIIVVIRKHIKASLNRSIYSWDFVDGYTNNPNNEGFAKRNPLQALELIERLTSETPALFLLKDFNRFLTDISISRKLKNVSRILKLQPKTIIIIGSEFQIPKELQDLITVLQFNLPLESEINQELTRLVTSLNIEVDPELFENLTRACQGLSLERIRRVLSKIIATYKTIDNNSINVLLSEKKQIIGQTEILEYCSWDVEPWNGMEITEDGYYVYQAEDEVWGSDIEWLHAIENSALCIDCPGDLDGNGSLGVSDLNIILSEFGCTESCQSDFNLDGSVTIADLLFWLSLFGTVC